MNLNLKRSIFSRIYELFLKIDSSSIKSNQRLCSKSKRKFFLNPEKNYLDYKNQMSGVNIFNFGVKKIIVDVLNQRISKELSFLSEQ